VAEPVTQSRYGEDVKGQYGANDGDVPYFCAAQPRGIHAPTRHLYASRSMVIR
jgi:hypothetical protein